MAKSALEQLCTPDALVRSNYYSDTYRADFKVGDIQHEWDITHISLPFHEQKERELMARFNISREELTDFYRDFGKCVKNEISLVNFLTETSANSVVKYVYPEINRKEGGGSDVYIVTEPFEAFSKSDYFGDEALSLNNILSLAARFLMIIKGLSEVGVHLGAVDLDCVYLSTTGDKPMITLGCFLYGTKDSDEQTSPKPKTLSLHAHPDVRNGANPTLESDIYAVTSLIWSISNGDHYTTPADFSKPPKYAPPEMVQLLNIGLAMDASRMKAMTTGFHGLMKKVKKGELTNTFIRLAPPIYHLPDPETEEEPLTDTQSAVAQPEEAADAETATQPAAAPEAEKGQDNSPSPQTVTEHDDTAATETEQPEEQKPVLPPPKAAPEPIQPEPPVPTPPQKQRDRVSQEEPAPEPAPESAPEQTPETQPEPAKNEPEQAEGLVFEVLEEDIIIPEDAGALPYRPPAKRQDQKQDKKNGLPDGAASTRSTEQKPAEIAARDSSASPEPGKGKQKRPKKKLLKNIASFAVAACLIAAFALAGFFYLIPMIQTYIAPQPDAGTEAPEPPETATEAPEASEPDDEPTESTEAATSAPEATESTQAAETTQEEDSETESIQAAIPPQETTTPPQTTAPPPATTTPPPQTQPTEPPTTTKPPATTKPPVTTQPPATTKPPAATQPPATTPPTTTPPTTTPPATLPPETTVPPATTTPQTTPTPSGEELLTVTPATVTLSVGEKVYLKPSVSCQWSSSDSGVASFRNGYVTGVGKGTCVITAKTKTQTFKVTVTVE